MKEKRHIDDVQPATVDEHIKLIHEDRSLHDTEFVKVTPNDLPDWFDERLFKIGQTAYMDNILGFGIANLTGLIAILCVPDITKILVFTRRSSTISLSFRRYMETLLLIYELFKSDMLKADSKWFQAINVIRWKHALATKRHIEHGGNGIYMKDMAITQFGFIGYALTCPDKVGLSHCTLEQREGFNYFWRVTAHMLGISDRLNICRKTAAETTELCRKIASEIIKEHLLDPLPESEQLVSYAVQGVWYIDPTYDEDAIIALMMDMTGIKYKKRLGWYSTLNMKLREWNSYLHSAPYIGILVRIISNRILMMLYWLGENHSILARIAFGKQKSSFCPYPKIE
ncbi:uncharacterized protein LOC143346761 [Colletes latitarsis]|uniref:uncharacterized protein LOC143346761 n=1 Tax=Colletes latitarsis TaxID=2605962 RepID=UPI0040366E4E